MLLALRSVCSRLAQGKGGDADGGETNERLLFREAFAFRDACCFAASTAVSRCVFSIASRWRVGYSATDDIGVSYTRAVDGAGVRRVGGSDTARRVI